MSAIVCIMFIVVHVNLVALCLLDACEFFSILFCFPSYVLGKEELARQCPLSEHKRVEGRMGQALPS